MKNVMTTERHECSETIYSGRMGLYRHRCSRTATVQRDVTRIVYPGALKVYNEETFTFDEVKQATQSVTEPKWFCGTHDPQRINARDAKKQAAESAERAERDRKYNNALKLIKVLGVGRPEYIRGEGSTGNIVITQREVTVLLEKLGVMPKALAQ